MAKLQKIQQHLVEHDLSAGLITHPDNIFYISNFRTEPYERLTAILIFQEADPFIICPSMEVADVKAAGWQYDVVGYQDTDNAFEVMESAIMERISKITLLAIEKEHLSVDRYEILQERFPATQFTKLDETLHQTRLIKSDDELQHLRKAAELADFAVEVGCRELAEGKTELEVLQVIEMELRKKGVQNMAFDPIVLFGKKTASPHGVPGSQTLQKGDFVLFDLGVVYNGYCSDITRTVAFGEPSEEMKTIYNIVKEAQQSAINAVKPKAMAKEIDLAARTIIDKAGYGDCFPHRIGHGIGISVHEFPSLTFTNELELERGMAFTIEPGIYKPGLAGVRIEDDVVVTEDGVEVLTNYPKDLQIIE